MSVIRRLPRYYRYLAELNQEKIVRISSRELASRMRLTASQIRQDLNCFGGFGQQGYGYVVNDLKDRIAEILGITQSKKAIVLGAGHLGQAVACYLEYETEGFQVIGIFDNNPKIIGETVFDGMNVLDVAGLEEFCSSNQPEMAVVCTPKEPTGDLIRKVYDSGVRFFWNFSHFNISREYHDVTGEAVHLNDSAMTLRYLMTK